jgi:phosphate transport system substrate-binding protein
MKKTMTRVFMTVLAVSMLAACLTACAQKSTNAAQSTQTASQSTQSQSTQSAGTAASAASSAKKDLTGTITVSGSSALLPLAQAASDKFKEVYPNISMTLNAGGSGTGLKQVADGSVDIGDSDVFAEEKLDAATAKELVDHQVCVITMAAIVNNDVGAAVTSLTKQQLIDVFSGKTTNWKDVGGPDEKILLVTRPDSSGTRALFTKWALDGASENSNASYLETDNSGELLQTVKDNKGAIGYLALSYLVSSKDVTPLAIDGSAPTLENTYSGKYPVWGYEHMYTKGQPNEAVQAYLDFITSADYAGSMEAQGYGVASKMTVKR